MEPININVAESIIEPFWDPEISTLDKWNINNKNVKEVLVEQTWCTVSFRWRDSKSDSKVISMEREYENLSVVDMDMLVISAALTKGTSINIKVMENSKVVSKEFIGEDDKKYEYEIDLSCLNNITKIQINIGSYKKSEGSGWFNWIGLVNSQLLNQYLNSSKLDGDAWKKHLKPIDYIPSYKPTYGILMDEKDIDTLREMVSKLDNNNNPLNDIRNYKKLNNPEAHVNTHINFFHDTRYNRVRDEGNFILKKGENAAVAGIIQKDSALLRLAARYALTIAACEYWDDGFICNFQTSSFNHRCFVQSLALYECSIILDLAGEFFTEVGRDYVLRKMAEEGIGAINFNTWKYEYIFTCNQLSWFSPGRMYGYAVLMKHYPRIEPYMDIALNEVIENINNTVEADGGYLEGPGYFACVGRDALLALYIYANVKKIDIKELIPDVMQKTINFGEVLESTDKMVDFIPICDVKPI